MSDSIRDDINVDPRLDALLSGALGRASVSREQRQRHLERLGLAPRLGGSAGTWRSPVVAGHPSTSTPTPESHLSRRRRQWLELGAAALAIVLVGALLAALFRDWSGGEDDQFAASPEATAIAVTATLEPSTATPTPEPTSHERLFVVSHTLAIGRAIESGLVTSYDAETGDIAYTIDTGENPDAVLSSDGTRVYVIANDEERGDILTSHDALTGDENWSVAVENRVQWMRGEGPTTLAISQDGSRLFVYSASAPGDYKVQVFDTADGRPGRVINGVAGCTAQLFPSADWLFERRARS